MKQALMMVAGIIMIGLLAASNAAAHCEVPCGIYDDELRAKLIFEHSTTIEKSMQEIMKLGQTTPLNYNQLVRWVNNKEKHAKKIQLIVSQYFMTQRIKPNAKQYADKVTVLHQMLIAAMKCKQTTDLAHVQKLRSLLSRFEKLYFGHALN